jgi:hypothetical protein
MLFLCLLLINGQAMSAELKTELPDDDLLDYLGQWQQVDGEWVDPMQLQEISMIEQDSSKGERNEE